MRLLPRVQRRAVSPLIEWGPPYASRLIRATRVLSPKPAGPLVVEGRDGFRFALGGRIRGSSAAVYYHGIYEAGTLHVLTRALRRGGIFFDVGAHFGLMSAYGSAAVGAGGSVHAFEPHPERMRSLERTLELNALKNVITHPTALGSRPGWAAMSPSPAAGTIKEPGRKTISVPVERLDDVAARVGVPQAVKVDVEGWELPVLEGAQGVLSGPEAPLLCIECSIKRAGRDDRRRVYELVRSCNRYEAFVLRGGKDAKGPLRPVGSAGQLPEHDNVFYLTPVHIARGRDGSWFS